MRLEDTFAMFLDRVVDELPFVDRATPPGWGAAPYQDPDQPIGPLGSKEWDRLRRMARREQVNLRSDGATHSVDARLAAAPTWLLRKRSWLARRDEERTLVDLREEAVLSADRDLHRDLERIDEWLSELSTLDPSSTRFCDEQRGHLTRGDLPPGAVREVWARRHAAIGRLVDILLTDELRASVAAILARSSSSATEVARAVTPVLAEQVRASHPQLGSIPALFAALSSRLQRQTITVDDSTTSLIAAQPVAVSTRFAPAGPGVSSRGAAVVKQSHEGNADVQHWLQEHALDAAGTKARFEPRLLLGRRDREWVLSSLDVFYQQDLIDDVLYVAKTGKEATVYCCTPGPACTLPLLAAKVYRPRMFRSLKNDAIYRENRQQRDRDGGFVRKRPRGNGGTSARSARVSAWIEYEYETHCIVHEAGGDVPQPVAQAGNAVLMEFLGDELEPAPRLSDVRVEGIVAQRLFEQALRNIELWLACHRVHGDLSMYNVLYRAERLWFIDFAQAVDPRCGDETRALLERDVERIVDYFSRYGAMADARAIAASLWDVYLRGG